MPNNILTEYDVNALDEAIKDIKLNNFEFAHNMQKLDLGYKRYNFTGNQLQDASKIMKLLEPFPSYYYLELKGEFIKSYKREAFRKSDFFNKRVDMQTISTNFSVFSYNFLVFIDGKLTKIPKLFINDESSYILFDINEPIEYNGVTDKTYIYELIQNNANITIYRTPNFLINSTLFTRGYSRENNNVCLPELNTEDYHYVNNPNVGYLTFTSYLNSERQTCYLNNHDTPTTNFVKPINYSLNISTLGLPFLKSSFTITSDKKYFQIDENIPVDVNNIMIFSGTPSELIFEHNIYLEFTKPNIYKIIGNEDNKDLTFIYFNHDENFYKFNKRHKLYDEIKGEGALLADVSKGILPKFLKLYKDIKPEKLVYNRPDFDLKSRKDFVDYKTSIFNDVFKEQEEVLYYLLDNLIDITNTKSVLKAKNLNLSREFLDDSLVVGEEDKTIFTEPHILLCCQARSFSEFWSRRYTIDGIYQSKLLRYHDGQIEYAFIPKSMITLQTIIEIDTFIEVNKQYKYSFSQLYSDIFHCDLNLFRKDVYSDNIFLTDKFDNYVPRDFYQILIKDYNGNLVPIPKNNFFEKLGEVYICLTSFGKEYIGEELDIRIVSSALRMEEVGKKKSVPIFTINKYFNNLNIKNHVRIYKNGRCIPYKYISVFDYDDKYQSTITISAFIDVEDGDSLICYIDPNPSRVVYFNEIVDEKTFNGLLNARSSLENPLSLKWHDFYVNGYKLNENTLRIFSTTIFQYFYKCNLNVEIRERFTKPLNWQLSLLYEDSIEESIFEELKEEVKIKFPIITELDKINIVNPSIDPLGYQLAILTNSYLLGRFVNPNENQVTDYIQRSFDELIDENGNIYLNPEISVEYGGEEDNTGFINANI